MKRRKGGGKTNGTPRASDSDPGESEEDSGTADQIAAMQQQMNEQIERQVAEKMREERARMAQALAQDTARTAQGMTTPRRGGPPGPGTPASTLGKRIHGHMRRMWEDTEMGISQAFTEYQDAMAEFEVAIGLH